MLQNKNRRAFTAVAIAQMQRVYRFWGIGKYSATSLLATALDFLLFIILIRFSPLSVVIATAIGRLAGALLTLLLHRYWVFRHVQRSSWRKLLFHYCVGNVLGIWLNMAGVWFFCQKVGISAIVSRILVAFITWYFLYVFYKQFVYRRKQVSA